MHRHVHWLVAELHTRLSLDECVKLVCQFCHVAFWCVDACQVQVVTQLSVTESIECRLKTSILSVAMWSTISAQGPLLFLSAVVECFDRRYKRYGVVLEVDVELAEAGLVTRR